ncbi:M23 family metallopeptidase [Cupriavidus pauculus]|uniref:M23 family metallopeptidase n=1 Tax=Cupriavidus pauculus TaxID=82633 RepID=UPI000785F60E|nr:M23 family metallopeptidase [Cupriavidus pauculus]MBY4734509.1 M23 family metallopeptidase [Cupriavidus pauculus]
MIISPPFLPCAGRSSVKPSEVDPTMTAVNKLELEHGIYPVAFDRRWHCGVHLAPSTDSEVHAIADGEVVTYRVCQHAYDGGSGRPDSNAGFVLLKHTTETGEGRTLTFYSLYMHLLELAGYQSIGADAKRLPEFLRMPQAGAGPSQVPSAQQGAASQKVLRKQVLGWIGQCHGQKHLHFEVFMTKKDFDAYFGQTQLGKISVTTPPGTDYWGHSYYVIPTGRTFVSLPPGTLLTKDGKHKISGVEFDVLAAGENTDTLYVESWFHKGDKYTRVWRDTGEGKREELTAQPIIEPGYEYDLYKRASSLYPTCPSDGYELLRFGRILTTPATLSAAPTGVPPPIDSAPGRRPGISAIPVNRCSIWMRAAFAAGQQGYVDVSDPAIEKLSDADFPFFKGWQKISEGSGPFGNDGLCDIDALKTILNDTTATQSPQELAQTEEYQKEDALVRYVKSKDSIRGQLRGFVCEATSQWDSSQNEAQYGKLKNVGEFYHGNEAGYEKFIRLLKSFQFWGKTGLPAEEKLWFFHPLEFIEIFRRCGWLSESEFKQIYSDDRYGRSQQPSPAELRDKYLKPFNLAARKFGLASPIRLAHFLGQGAMESGWLASMQETSMLGRVDATGFHGTAKNPASMLQEATLGHWYGQIPSEDDAWFRSVKFNSHGSRITGSYDWKSGNCDREDSQKFRGRGFKQLTGRSNYADYWVFRGWIDPSSFSQSWWSDPAYVAHNRSGMKKIPAEISDPHRVALPENCIDSGGFYLRGKRPRVAQKIDKDLPHAAKTDAEKKSERDISRAVTIAINGGYIGDEQRLEFTRAAKRVLF